MLPAPFDTLEDQSWSPLIHSKGDHVFRQGDATRGVFLLLSGTVCLTRVTESGNAVVVHNPQAGEMFAEASLYSDVYHCDAICSSPAEVTRISKQAILKRQRRDAAFSEAITRRLAVQVQGYRQLLTLHASKSANDRVLQAVALGKLIGSVTQFANQIGLTKEACYRALRDLSHQGLLLKTGRGQYEPTPRAKGRFS